MDFDPEPDLHPLYPTAAHLSALLSSDSGLDPTQKAELVKHCLKRACLFGDLSLAQFLIRDSQAQAFLDLSAKDEDGVGLVSLTIHVFGGDPDRDIEREECVRLLVSQGADLTADKAGWTPLHHAALLAPPTLVVYLMTHGCSPFDVTEKNLTPLDIITAHSVLPGREDVAMLLEEAMRGEGWTGGRMEQKRRHHDRLSKRKGKQRAIRDDVSRVLGVNPRWWTSDENDADSDSDDDDAEDEDVFTPPTDYSSMLVFNPIALPEIFDTLITSYPIALKDPTPANTLYMLARFACLTCDHTWLEDLIMGAADTIEEAFFNNADDLTTLVFWLHNTTLWLHLMQCDNTINEACEMLGSFELIEEVINSVFVFIIRFAERRIDELLDSALLDYAPQGSESETVQFESEWNFLRPFTKKKVPAPIGVGQPPGHRSHLPSPEPTARPITPSRSKQSFTSTTPKFSSLKQTIARAQATATGKPPPNASSNPTPYELTSFLTALQTLLVFADINPSFTTQLWSQVFYWTSCEIFNRVISRKKYVCRSRAIQISMNMAVIEEWVDEMNVPPGVLIHFAPVRDLLSWIQCLSSITDFPELVAVIQSLKGMNPLQMRRAVRDYKYEVNEGRMTEECVQYITQLQKDWERHRVKLGVEALRKEISERDRDRDDAASTIISGSLNGDDQESIMSVMSMETTSARQAIDLLFDKQQEITFWEPPKPPQVLGELLDSRYMLPLLFPADPRFLAALPSKSFLEMNPLGSQPPSASFSPGSTSKGSIDFGRPGPLLWRSRNKKIREAGVGVLQWVDGLHSASRWWRPLDQVFHDDVEEQEDTHVRSQEGANEDEPVAAEGEAGEEQGNSLRVQTQFTPFTRKPSIRNKGRASMGDVTPIDPSFNAPEVEVPRTSSPT